MAGLSLIMALASAAAREIRASPLAIFSKEASAENPRLAAPLH